MTSISKNVYFDKLDDIVNKWNHAYGSTIKRRLVDVNSRKCIDFNKMNKEKDPKFKVGHQVGISKSKNIFANAYIPNLSKKLL